ncbi:DUF4279 domain-containing protein [Nonomuraea sp. NPDC049646]|uniref:DUF4279 domain-containing protein n=1 Tax=unclassified Nonomuraea TaxID=2593643 RepID=UPI0037B6CF74
MSAVEMAARLGLEPDVVTVRGSRRLEPPHPTVHISQINGPRSSRQPVDDMILALVGRLEPYAKMIGAVVDELDRHEPGNTATIQVVRFFGSEEDGVAAPVVPALPATPARHRQLGWHPGRRVLDFLQVTRAELDVDEYGDNL